MASAIVAFIQDAAAKFDTRPNHTREDMPHRGTTAGTMLQRRGGSDREAAEYFYSGCALGHYMGCQSAVAYAAKGEASLPLFERRIEVARKGCQIGVDEGCALLAAENMSDALITDPMKMNPAEARWYAISTKDYAGAARSIIMQNPKGLAWKDSAPVGTYLGELVQASGAAGLRGLDDDAFKILQNKQFWYGRNKTATNMVLAEWKRRVELAQAEKERERATRRAQQQRWAASQPTSQVENPVWRSDGTRNPYTRKPSAKICTWVTAAGIGGGRYRKCD